jgi:hypothetical protein
MPKAAFRKASVIEDHLGLGRVLFEFKLDDRINTGVPVFGAPSLDDPLVGYQFNISSNHQILETIAGSIPTNIRRLPPRAGDQ